MEGPPSVISTADLGKIICLLGPESSEPSQQSTSPLLKLDEVRTSTFISEELLLTPSEPLFNWSLEMTTMSEPFLPKMTRVFFLEIVEFFIVKMLKKLWK